MKVAGSSEPAPEAPIDDAPPADAAFGDEPQPSSDDKPFDDEPFDAGVEADEQSDPKKYIEQLTGKLGQSLRTYNEKQGQPDFELEKFAINSLLSAAHTSQMDQEDQDDIIKKVKEAGNHDDSAADSQDDSNDDNNDSTDFGDVSGDGDSTDFGGDLGDDSAPSEDELQENQVNLFLDEPKRNNMFQPGSNDVLKEENPCWDGYEKVKGKKDFEKGSCKKINENAGESQNYMFWQNLKTIHHAAGELLGMDQAKVDQMIANGHAWAVDHIATSSDDIEEVYHFLEANLKGDLNISEKSSIFGKIKSKLKETFNQEETMSEPMIQPQTKPVVKPAPDKVQPNIAPSRRNKPFLPMPDVKPDPKAVNENDDFIDYMSSQKDWNHDTEFRVKEVLSFNNDYVTMSIDMRPEIEVMTFKRDSLVARPTETDDDWIFDYISDRQENGKRYSAYLTFLGPDLENLKWNGVKPMDVVVVDENSRQQSLNEGQSKYEIYHKTLSSALDTVREYVARLGFDPIEFDINDIQHVAYGQTERFNKELTKNGKPLRQTINVQIYRMDSGTYELNMYVA